MACQLHLNFFEKTLFWMVTLVPLVASTCVAFINIFTAFSVILFKDAQQTECNTQAQITYEAVPYPYLATTYQCTYFKHRGR